MTRGFEANIISINMNHCRTHRESQRGGPKNGQIVQTSLRERVQKNDI